VITASDRVSGRDGQGAATPGMQLLLARWEDCRRRFADQRAGSSAWPRSPEAARASAAQAAAICAEAVPLLTALAAEGVDTVDAREGLAAVRRALEDRENCWFVAEMLRTRPPLAAALFGPLIAAAIRVDDPSWNRAFIDPCADAFGLRETATAILAYLESGTFDERASAAAALYWIRVRISSLTYGPAASGRAFEDASAESRERYSSFADLRQTVRLAVLRTFVQTEDAECRSQLADYLEVPCAEPWPEEVAEAVQAARRVGREHPKQATRSKAERKLGP
jgi:hypothetical protein